MAVSRVDRLLPFENPMVYEVVADVVHMVRCVVELLVGRMFTVAVMQVMICSVNRAMRQIS